MAPQVAAVYGDPGTADTNPANDVLLTPSKDYGALIRVSNGNAVRALRENVNTALGGIVTIGDGAKLDGGKALLIDSTRNAAVAASAQLSGASLSLASGRIGLGGGTEGLILDVTSLARLANTQHLTLRSYTSIDFHSSINFGGAGLSAVTLDAAGLVGYGTSPVTITGGTIVLDNSGGSFAEPMGAGHGHLALIADELVLGRGTKALRGFDTIALTGGKRIVGEGNGGIDTGSASVILTTPVLTGRGGASQSIVTTGALTLTGGGSGAVENAGDSLGSRIALTGGNVAIDGRIVGLGGAVEITATDGDIVLSEGSLIDVGGFAKQFFDIAQYADAGRISLTSVGGDVRLNAGAALNLAAVSGGGSAGRLSVTAVDGGTVKLDGTVAAQAGAGGKGGSFALDIDELPDFAAMSQKLNTAGFFASRQFRIREGNVEIAGTTRVDEFELSADTGVVTMTGAIDARSEYGGTILISGGGGLVMAASADLKAGATHATLGSGRVTLEATGGMLDVQGGTIDVSGGEGGKVRFRARQIANSATPNIPGHTDIAVTALNATITGSAVLEGVSTYQSTTTGAVKAQAIADAATFASSISAIVTRLGLEDADVGVMAGIQIESAGDLTVDGDWNLFADFAAQREGTLTLRAGGNLNVNGNISDGFDLAGRTGVLQDTVSWDLRLIAGADLTSASAAALRPMAALAAGSGSLIVGSSAAGKVIRTGTGDIDVRAGRDVDLAHNESVIYTAGRKDMTAWADFNTAPVNGAYGISGGHLRMIAQGDVSSALPANRAPMQLYIEWLKRQGAVDGSFNFAPHGTINEQSSWWVDYGAFQQGVGALGGGNVEVSAGGDLVNLLVALPTNGRVRGGRTSAERKLLELRNGGSMTVDAGGAVRAGYYYIGRGAGTIDAGEFTTGRFVDINMDNKLTSYPIAPVLSLGDATLSVRTTGELRLQTVLDPLMVGKGQGNANAGSFMSGQTDRTALDLTSVGGDVVLVNQARFLSRDLTLSGAPNGTGPWYYEGMNINAGNVYPSKVRITALNGSVENLETFYMLPGSAPELRILAENNVVPGAIVMSRATLEMIPSPFVPVGANGAPIRFVSGFTFNEVLYNDMTLPPSNISGLQRYLYGFRDPEHLPNEDDYEPSRIYARTGSIVNTPDVNLGYRSVLMIGLRAVTTNEQTWFRAGTDIRGIDYRLRNVHGTDVSLLEAGNDIIGGSITVQGPGAVTLEAGRDVYGTDFQINSVGNRTYDENNRPLVWSEISGLPDTGASISVLAGLNGKRPSYDAFMAAYLDPANLAAMPDYLKTILVDASTGLEIGMVPRYFLDIWEDRGEGDVHRINRGLPGFVEETTGRPANSFADAWTTFQSLPRLTQETFLRRVYTQELREAGKNQNTPGANGLPINGGYNRGYTAIATLFPGDDWKGDVSIGSAKFRTLAGGDIDVLTPGGGLQVAGLGVVVPAGSGIIALGAGDINIFARDSITVNRSRILTFGGGDEIMWSTLGDIDAGRGAKTSRVPSAAEVTTDLDAITAVLEKADISGSGIGTIVGFTGAGAGDLHLIAPEGTVNAGDAGVRVSGNLNLAALHVANVDNFDVDGETKGLPPVEAPDIGGLTEASNTSGAAQQSGPPQTAPNEQPSIIIVEVLGFGGGDGSSSPESEEEERRRKAQGQRTYNTNGAVQVLGHGALTDQEQQLLSEDEKRRL
jgi:hypothetical protein